MNGWLEIAASGPRLWIAIVIAAAGLWLSYVLYIRLYIRGGRLLAIPYAVAWMFIAFWVLAPAWRSKPEIWHPPAVLLMTDESASYGGLGAHAAGESSRRAARDHYESLGFRVVEAPWNAREGRAEILPNLQAVLLWSDGRFGADVPFPSVPVFPVSVPLQTHEVQGESAFVALTEGTPRAVELTVAWRALGTTSGATPASARVELRHEGTRLWDGDLKHPAEGAPGSRATSRVTLPVALTPVLESAEGAVMLIVRPARSEDNTLTANDTVPVDLSRLHRGLQVFVRPLTALHERGLMDALRAEEEYRVEAMPAARAATLTSRGTARSVVWVARSRAQEFARAADSGRAVIVYDVYPGTAGAEFGPDARIGRDVRAAVFLPAGALRLADLGLGADGARWKLSSPGKDEDVLAWAEEGGRRGVLFARDRARHAYVFAVPPLWDARLRAGATRGEGDAFPSHWVRGVAAWAGHAGSVAPSVSNSTTRVRVGEDVEALAALAARRGGHVLRDEAWPRLRDAQVREARARVTPLAPSMPLAFIVIALFAGVWYGRKRLQLD